MIDREKVEATPRKAITKARKERCWTREKGKCWFCGQEVEMTGPNVRYDHRLPLELGGADDDANLFPLHTAPCDKIKYKSDRVRIDKARRLRKREDGTRRERPKIASRDFDKSKTKGFDGKVRERK